MTVREVITRLQDRSNPRNVEAMAGYGIASTKALGVPLEVLRSMAREIGHDHRLALGLWTTGILDARILAAFVDEPARVTGVQMDRWAAGFDSWAVCDGVCLHLFVKTPHAHGKARLWSSDKREFVRRAGFTLMACLAVHDKRAPDSRFERFFPLIIRTATDERNFVKKAVNWALRQIGKRNRRLNKHAIRVGERIRRLDSGSARWIASDALRELRSPAVQKRVKR